MALGTARSISSVTSSLVSRERISLISSDKLWMPFCLYRPVNSPHKSDLADCFQNLLFSFAGIGMRLFAISSIHSRISWSVTWSLWFSWYKKSHPNLLLSWKLTMTTSGSSILRDFDHNSPLMSTQNIPVSGVERRLGMMMAELLPEPEPPMTRTWEFLQMPSFMGLHR